MTATLHRLGAGSQAGLYYTNDAEREARPKNRDEYYSRGGDGVWWSTGETVVRHGSAVEVQSFRDLCAGIAPGSGKALVRGAGEGHQAGVDLTMTPGKSVSVLWMAGSAAQREQIERAHRTAVDRALQVVVDEGLMLVRHGAGGKHKARPADLIAAKFEHFSTREGDPNLHTHTVFMNVAGTDVASKRYKSNHLTIESERLFQWQMTIGAAYRSALAGELKTLGFSFREAGRGQWEIAGLPQSLLETFSKRSHQIEKLVGRDASAAQKQIAALATRGSKDLVLTGAELEARWRNELADTGINPWQVALGHVPEMAPTPDLGEQAFRQPEIFGATPVAVAASMLFETSSVIDRRVLLERAFVNAGLSGLGPDVVYDELGALETSGALLSLDADHWTTPAIAATEAAMLRAAARPQEHDWFNQERVQAALSDAPHLSHEQRDAVVHAAQSDGVSIIEAGAGTGKTTLANALVDAAQRSGLTVIGLAPSWVAAHELALSTGIPAQAIARWCWDGAKGTAAALTANTVVLLDEAGMIGTGDMQVLLTAAKAAGAKIVLLGDRRQLESVAGGSALGAVRDVVERSASLAEVRRQAVDWQRAASIVMAQGDSATGLRTYARYDRLELVDGEAAARLRVIEHWQTARREHGDDVLMITRRNIDASALNQAARAVLRLEGRIGAEEVGLPSVGRDGKPTDIKLSVGDKIRFGETLPHLKLRNGTRATIIAVNATVAENPTLSLKLENGDLIETYWTDLVRERLGRSKAIPRVVHAYAGTAYAAQGRTSQASVVYIAQQTDAREVYVGLTRHHSDVRIIVESGRLDASCRQRQEDRRIKPTGTAIREQLFVEAARYREKTNVIDYVGNRAAFIAYVTIGPTALETNRMEAALKGARAMQAVRQNFSSARLVSPLRNLMVGSVRLVAKIPVPLLAMISKIGSRTPKPAHTPKHDLEI